MDESVQKHLEQPAGLDEIGRLMLDAAKVIECRGLSCGMNDAQGRSCVIFTMYELGATFESVEAACDRLVSAGVECVPDWSDEAGRTGRHMEVVSKLRAVALA